MRTSTASFESFESSFGYQVCESMPILLIKSFFFVFTPFKSVKRQTIRENFTKILYSTSEDEKTEHL